MPAQLLLGLEMNGTRTGNCLPRRNTQFIQEQREACNLRAGNRGGRAARKPGEGGWQPRPWGQETQQPSLAWRGQCKVARPGLGVGGAKMGATGRAICLRSVFRADSIYTVQPQRRWRPGSSRPVLLAQPRGRRVQGLWEELPASPALDHTLVHRQPGRVLVCICVCLCVCVRQELLFSHAFGSRPPGPS